MVRIGSFVSNKFNDLCLVALAIFQLEYGICQIVAILISIMEFMNIDCVGINFALVGVGFASAGTTGVVAVFKVDSVRGRVSQLCILGDFSCISNHNSIASLNCGAFHIFDFLQIIKSNSQLITVVARRRRDGKASRYRYAANRNANAVFIISKALAERIYEIKSIGVIVGHVRNLGNQLKGYSVANLCRTIVLELTVFSYLYLLINSREGALDFYSSNTVFLGNIDQHSISTTQSSITLAQCITGRTTFGKYKVIASGQNCEGRNTLGFVLCARYIYGVLLGC